MPPRNKRPFSPPADLGHFDMSRAHAEIVLRTLRQAVDTCAITDPDEEAAAVELVVCLDLILNRYDRRSCAQ